MKDILASNIKLVLAEVDDISMEEIDSKLKELQWKLFKVANSNGNYNSITDEIYQLRELNQNVMVDLAEREYMKMSIDAMRQFMEEQAKVITECDEQLTRKLIEKMTVYEVYFNVEFKSGTSVDIHK